MNKENTPGPGTYNLKTFFKKQQPKMINDKLEAKYGYKFIGPGPSDYNPNKEKVLR